MTVPTLIKAGDESVKIGEPFWSPPPVDCRIVSEDNYQQFLKVLAMVRQHDIENFINGHQLMPISVRIAINDILTSHGI